MPIVIARSTGEILHMPEYTQADYDRAWEAVARYWAKTHPDALSAAIARDNGLSKKGGGNCAET